MRKLQFGKIELRLREPGRCTVADQDIKGMLHVVLAVILGIAGSGLARREPAGAFYGLWIGSVPYLEALSGNRSLVVLAGLVGAAALSATLAARLRRPFARAEHYKHLFDNAPIGIYRAAPDGR